MRVGVTSNGPHQTFIHGWLIAAIENATSAFGFVV